jgi:hypothetical protein
MNIKILKTKQQQIQQLSLKEIICLRSLDSTCTSISDTVGMAGSIAAISILF